MKKQFNKTVPYSRRDYQRVGRVYPIQILFESTGYIQTGKNQCNISISLFWGCYLDGDERADVEGSHSRVFTCWNDDKVYICFSRAIRVKESVLLLLL